MGKTICWVGAWCSNIEATQVVHLMNQLLSGPCSVALKNQEGYVLLLLSAFPVSSNSALAAQTV